MQFPLPTRLAALVLLGGGLALTGCDSNEDPDPIDQVTPYCDANNDAFGCPGSGIVYDTTVVNGVNRISVRETLENIGVAGDRTSITWSAGNEYVLEGLAFVNSGQTLTIEAGTVIRGNPGQGRRASALVVARGGRIQANGTAENPIIFTALADDLGNPNDLFENGQPVVGQWGGVILLGSARTNAEAGEVAIEGIDTSEPRGLYGGTNDADNSGTMRYISIRPRWYADRRGERDQRPHAGCGRKRHDARVHRGLRQPRRRASSGSAARPRSSTSRPPSAATTSSTTTSASAASRSTSSASWARSPATTAGEHDGGVSDLGGDAGEAAQPFAKPTFWNATYIGSGNGAANDSRIFNIRDNAGGFYHRSLFAEFTRGVAIEDRDDTDDDDSRARLEAGDLVFDSNVFANVGDGGTVASLFDEYAISFVTDDLRNNRYVGTTPLVSISRSTSGGLNPLPSGGVLTSDLGPAPDDNFFDNTSFIGAFGDTNWLLGWSALDAYGYLD